MGEPTASHAYAFFSSMLVYVHCTIREIHLPIVHSGIVSSMFEAIEALIEALASEGWTATDAEILSEIKVIESDAFDREILSTREKCTR